MHEKGARLHRDVTPGNIILYDDNVTSDVPADADRPVRRRGYLIDWELSRPCGSEDLELDNHPFQVSVSAFCEDLTQRASPQRI